MNDNNDAELEFRREIRRESVYRRTELVVWFILSFIVSCRFWVSSIKYGFTSETLEFRYLDLLVGILCMIFPFLYRLIFGLFPFEYKRLNRATAPKNDSQPKKVYTISDKEILRPTNWLREAYLQQDLSPYEIFGALVQSSKRLSERIFTRAGVYLIVGVLIAFSGLLFFYLQTAGMREILSNDSDSSFASIAAKQIGNLAPRFGILFFIEFIAFFFLRQYKSAMEEFRYFESVQRKREECFALLQFMKEDNEKVDIFRLIEAGSFFSGIDKLTKGETTELLESKKLTKDEMDVFMKIVDTVSRSK